MATPKILTELDGIPKRLWGRHNYKGGADPFSFLVCEEQPLNIPPVIAEFPDVEIGELEKYDCLHLDFGAPIVSKKFRNILFQVSNDKHQFIDVLMRTRDGEFKNIFYLINILNYVRCIDLDRSTFEEDDGEIMNISKLILLDNCMCEFDIARDIRYESYIFVSTRLENNLKKFHLKGVKLVYPEIFNAF